MEYLIRILIFAVIIGKFVIQGNISAAEVAVLLILVSANIFKHKFKVTWIGLIIEGALAAFGCIYSKNFSLIYALIAYDTGSKDMQLLVIPATALGMYFSSLNNVLEA
jgi:hypothetical protein